MEDPLISSDPGSDLQSRRKERDSTSVGGTIFNMVSTMAGSGILSVPYAFKLSGYFTFVILFFLVAVFAITADLIGRALARAEQRPEAACVPRDRRDYAWLAELAFGSRGRWVVGLVTSFEMWLVVVTFLVMSGLNCKLLLGLTSTHWIICCLALAVLMLPIPMRAYAYVSGLSLALLIGASISFAMYLFTLPTWAYPRVSFVPASTSNVFRSMGILIFCFAGHPCFPSFHQNMQETHRWTQGVRGSFCVALLYCGGLGAVAYVAVGEALEPAFTLNISSSAILFRRIVGIAFVVKVQLTMPLVIRATMIALGIWPADDQLKLLHPNVGKRTMSAKASLVFWAVPAFFVVTALGACFLADDLATIAALSGSMLVTFSSIIFPVAFYMCIRNRDGANEASRPMTTVCVFLMAFACFSGCAGTYFSVVDLVQTKTSRASAA